MLDCSVSQIQIKFSINQNIDKQRNKHGHQRNLVGARKKYTQTPIQIRVYLWGPKTAMVEVRGEARGSHVQQLVVVWYILPQAREDHRYVSYRFLKKNRKKNSKC